MFKLRGRCGSTTLSLPGSTSGPWVISDGNHGARVGRQVFEALPPIRHGPPCDASTHGNRERGRRPHTYLLHPEPSAPVRGVNV
jgi:hypothetical protein